MEEKKANPEYFKSIYSQLSTIESLAPWADQVLGKLQLLKMDIGFLEVLCLCFDTWDYSTKKEESMEILTSIITPLKVIWPKEHIGLSLLNRLAKVSPPEMMLIQDFHSAVFELEAKIHESKQLFEGRCEKLMLFSMQFKFSTISIDGQILKLIRLLWHLYNDLNYYSGYKVAEIIPLKHQIDILKQKISILLGTLKNVEGFLFTKEILHLLNVTCVFANKAAFLTCLYWAKESDEDIATEMNIVLFNMLQSYIPSAPDITPLFVGILKSFHSRLHKSDPFLLGADVKSIVGFFFDHLVTILKDEYLILRDRLVFLFTFLINPPCENAEQDSIRNQIYELFGYDAYLLLPFDEMKDDFSDKRMLLGDCMLKIDLAEANIRQLDNELSDSWIRLEVDELQLIHFVSILTELFSIEKHAQWAGPVKGELQLYILELRFLKMSLLCFATWDDTDEEMWEILEPVIISLRGIWEANEEKGLLAPRLHEIHSGVITDWHPLALELGEKIHLSKIKICACWVNWFHQFIQVKPTTSYTILNLLECILDNLQDLVNFKAGGMDGFEKQIETLKEKLVFLKNLLRLTANCLHSEELGEFRLLVQVFASGAALLSLVYWIADANGEIAYETNNILSRIMQKIKPATPDIASLYFETFQAIYAQQSDSQIFGEAVSKFADFFLGDSITLASWKDELEILRDDIMFLMTFLNDPPCENIDETICSQLGALYWEDLYGLLPFDDDGERDFINKKELLNDFMTKTQSVNANITQIYGNFPDSSLYKFPKVISPLFLDFLIQNLGNLKERLINDFNYAPFAKYKIIKIEHELVDFRPLFNHFFNLQSELDETWFEVVNSLHRIDHVICLSISSWFVFDHPIWYHMAHLSIVLDEIIVVKTKLEKIKENTMYNARCLPPPTGLITTHKEEAKPSEINEIIVGFDEDANKIIENIIQGSMSREVVSIVGMGGLGKTTLAKKVYGSSFVKSHFLVSSFCYVSQDPNTRKLLLDILGDVKRVDSNFKDMTDDGLGHELWKCLSGRNYLIILDDIWTEDAWNKIKKSFPDDNNGSRVVFTTRSLEVADKCKKNICPHQLRFLSEVESWDLLQKKVFSDGKSPPDLSEIGKQIAKNCKGLPLAIVVIAGLLYKTEKTLKWWSEVAERVVSYVSEKGCYKILELSYKHIPVNLKPCFVYLGTFPEDTPIKVKDVILLWIAEGFIQESQTKDIEDVGKEYIQDMVNRSLIIVNARSSTGGIKEFRVHDLIRDICQTKCREGNFMQINHGIASSNFSNPSTNHYRISTEMESGVTIGAVGSSLSNVRTFLYFSKKGDKGTGDLPFSELRHARLLNVDSEWISGDIKQLSALVHLRHIKVSLAVGTTYFHSSKSNLWNISNLCNISSITLRVLLNKVDLPDTFWTMKSLRHVKVDDCIFSFSDRYDQEAYPKLDKVVSFGKPRLSTGRDVLRLLQRLPAVRRLSCRLDDFDECAETFDFPGKLESLTLYFSLIGRKSQYLNNFPSTLKKLTLDSCQLPLKAILAIAELEFLEVLKLRRISFPEARLETEDLVFRKLTFLELYEGELVEWNASTESFPCIEQLVIRKTKLNEIPSCFAEIPTLMRIDARNSSPCIFNSALTIREEQRVLGIKVEVLVW